jgi:hypothetical protein
MASPPQVDPAASPLPREWVRTTVTFLIFVHFFFLLISIKSKTVSSGLEQDLRARAPGLSPYVQLLRMDLSYMFHLTYYDPTAIELAKQTPDPQDDRQTLLDFRPMDTEFYVEADLFGPNGNIEKTILWPSADIKPGARRQRFERLVQTAVANIDNANYAPVSDIARGIADRIMAENQVRSAKLRFRRRVLQNLMVPQTSSRFQAEKGRNPDASENFPLVYKPEMNREPSVYEITALRTDDGNVLVTEAQSGYNSAAPRQTADPAPVPLPNLKPLTIPLGTAAPTGAVKP